MYLFYFDAYYPFACVVNYRQFCNSQVHIILIHAGRIYLQVCTVIKTMIFFVSISLVTFGPQPNLGLTSRWPQSTLTPAYVKCGIL